MSSCPVRLNFRDGSPSSLYDPSNLVLSLSEFWPRLGQSSELASWIEEDGSDNSYLVGVLSIGIIFTATLLLWIGAMFWCHRRKIALWNGQMPTSSPLPEAPQILDPQQPVAQSFYCRSQASRDVSFEDPIILTADVKDSNDASSRDVSALESVAESSMFHDLSIQPTEDSALASPPSQQQQHYNSHYYLQEASGTNASIDSADWLLDDVLGDDSTTKPETSRHKFSSSIDSSNADVVHDDDSTVNVSNTNLGLSERQKTFTHGDTSMVADLSSLLANDLPSGSDVKIKAVVPENTNDASIELNTSFPKESNAESFLFKEEKNSIDEGEDTVHESRTPLVTDDSHLLLDRSGIVIRPGDVTLLENSIAEGESDHQSSSSPLALQLLEELKLCDSNSEDLLSVDVEQRIDEKMNEGEHASSSVSNSTAAMTVEASHNASDFFTRVQTVVESMANEEQQVKTPTKGIRAQIENILNASYEYEREVFHRGAKETNSTHEYNGSSDERSSEESASSTENVKKEEQLKEYECSLKEYQSRRAKVLRRLHRCRGLVILCCSVLLMTSLLSVLFGVWALEDQRQDVLTKWEDVQAVMQTTLFRVLEFIPLQTSIESKIRDVTQLLDRYCPVVAPSLCNKTDCVFSDIPLQNEWSSWWNLFGTIEMNGDLLKTQDWESVALDAQMLVDQPISAQLNGWNWALWASVTCNALLSFACLLILISMASRRAFIHDYVSSWSFCTLFWISTILTWIFGVCFIVGTILAADTCTANDSESGEEGPATITKHLLKGMKTQSFLPLYWDYFVDGCPSDMYPDSIDSQVWEWGSYLSTATALSAALDDYSDTVFIERCGTLIEPVRKSMSSLNTDLCIATQSLVNVRRNLGCDQWYPWYEAIANQAICEDATQAFVWTCTCQIIILLMAFMIWTLRVSFLSLKPSITTLAQTNDQQRNLTATST